MTRVAVYGGPFDGCEASASKLPYGYIDPQGCVFQKPDRNRALYRYDSEAWCFCGFDAWECRNCGALVELHGDPVKCCALCGHPR